MILISVLTLTCFEFLIVFLYSRMVSHLLHLANHFLVVICGRLSSKKYESVSRGM